MKFSVSTYSFGDYREENSLGIFGVIDKAAEMGFDGIEFVEDYWLEWPDEEIKKVGQYARDKGLETVAFCVGADLINRENEVERVCGLIDKAALLGVSMLRHDITSGVYGKKNGIGYACLLPELKEKCTQITEYAKKLGIKTMTENHGYFSQDADRVASLIDAVGNDNFGVLLDLGNFMCADEDPSLSASRLAPYAFHVHCKDFLYKKGTEINPGEGWFVTRAGNYLRGTIVGHGEAKIAQSLRMLKKKGYDGFISLEFEGTEDNLVGIKMGLSNIKRFWEMA
ncbi:MAG: sugar phosphate isomerase/epimerase [Clostridia bacterium]|nr:sugar phosphate isomerase/epimerase [Clostridia bacterium]